MALYNNHPVEDGETFHSGKVALRLVTLADCTERYLGWLQDPHVNGYLETRWREQSISSVKAFVTRQREDGSTHLFAITLAEDGHHVGNLKIGPCDPNHGNGDLSYFVGEPSMWGRGIASDAVRAAIKVAFVRIELARLKASTYASNRGSERVLEKVGFTKEGELRNHVVGPRGKREDVHVYGLLATDEEPQRLLNP